MELAWRQAHQIFEECFPQFDLPEEMFYRLLDGTNSRLLTVMKVEQLAGFAVISANIIRLLCVAPQHQNQGVGKKLLERCEKEIKQAGFKQIILGGTDAPLFMGAVTTAEDYANMQNPYFEKMDYHANGGCIEMELSLEQFDLSKINVPIPTDVEFRYYTEDDRQPLYDAVAAVREDWVSYFPEARHVYVAYRSEQLISFAILDFDCENLLSRQGNKVGSIGCVGTVPSGRESGIGIALVALATDELKKHNCTDCFIHWTHLEKWYGKLGYCTFMRYWFGEKVVKN